MGTAVAVLHLRERRAAALVGGITLGNIRHGVAQTGQIGYWMGERYAGQGLMLEALGLLVRLRLRDAEVAPDRGSLYSGQRSGRSACLKKPDFSAKDCCDPTCRSTASGRITISMP